VCGSSLPVFFQVAESKARSVFLWCTWHRRRVTMDLTTDAMTSRGGSSNVTSSSELSRIAWIRSTVSDCYFYSMGAIIPTGLLCNAFCLTVCGLSHGLRRTTTGHYLMALAVADSLFLVGDLIRWMNSSDFSGQYR